MKFFSKLYTMIWCWIKGCNGYTGEHAECVYCPAYNPSNTHCDNYKDDKDTPTTSN